MMGGEAFAKLCCFLFQGTDYHDATVFVKIKRLTQSSMRNLVLRINGGSNFGQATTN